MKKTACLILAVIMCVALLGCRYTPQNSGGSIGNQNRPGSGNSSQGSGSGSGSSNSNQGNSNSGSSSNNQGSQNNGSASNASKPEKAAETALRLLLENESVAGTLSVHYNQAELKVMLGEMYKDVLEDLNMSAKYQFISCKHVSTRTVTSGDAYEGINDGMSYFGANTFSSLTECCFEVVHTIRGTTRTQTIPVYLANVGGNYVVVQIYIG